MDTTKFMMTMGWICRDNQCEDCMLNFFCQKIWYDRTKEDVEKATKLVEEWLENHPVKTRQTEFLKKFPNAAVSHGTINNLPWWLDETLQKIAMMGILESVLSVEMLIGVRRLSEYAMDKDWI